MNSRFKGINPVKIVLSNNISLSLLLLSSEQVLGIQRWARPGPCFHPFTVSGGKRKRQWLSGLGLSESDVPWPCSFLAWEPLLMHTKWEEGHPPPPIICPFKGGFLWVNVSLHRPCFFGTPRCLRSTRASRPTPTDALMTASVYTDDWHADTHMSYLHMQTTFTRFRK